MPSNESRTHRFSCGVKAKYNDGELLLSALIQRMFDTHIRDIPRRILVETLQKMIHAI